MVPIIGPLRLLVHRVKPAYGWLFPNSIGGFGLPNLAERVIKPRLERSPSLEWLHSYRTRGLATNLHAIGVDDKRIQAILRHEDVSTTQRLYYQNAATNCYGRDGNAKISPCVTLVSQAGSSAVVN